MTKKLKKCNLDNKSLFKKKNKWITEQGFTLIELLAVIVILAIIMIIITPSIISIIDEARKGAFKNSVYGIIKSAENEYSSRVLKNNYRLEIIYTYTNGIETSNPSGYKLDYKGTKPKNGTIIVNGSGEVSLALHNGTYCIEKDYNENTVTLTNKRIKDCHMKPVYVDKSGANKPELSTGMTPVIWDGTKWVETDIYSNWYDYDEQRWANVRTNDGSYFVWIPRYAYKITASYHRAETGTIDIKFLNGKTNETLDATQIEFDNYVTNVKDTSMHYFKHPAFSFGNEEITGFWVAKFEPSVANLTDACNTNESTANCNKITLIPKIVPTIKSWRYITPNNMFVVSMSMKTQKEIYGWNENEVDTHMMKNNEWGAITYLSKSKYGTSSVIYSNNSSSFITGCAGNEVSSPQYSGCQNIYHTTIGQRASTTGNIYGVYDMSGGSWEVMAAYINNNHTDITSHGQSILNAESKYKNVYIKASSDTRPTNYNSNRNVYGDAVYEISSSGDGGTFSWDNSVSSMPNQDGPYFIRGGGYNNAGIFSFHFPTMVSTNAILTFRPIVVIK